MKVHPPFFRAVTAMGFAVIPLLAADPEPTFDLKIHGGVTAGDLRTLHQDNKIFGFGVAGRFPLGATNAFTVELGFDYIPGRDHDVMPISGSIYLPSGLVDAHGGPIDERPTELNVANSIDFRKESAQGFSLRGTYTDRLPLEGGWYWFAGASLDIYKTNYQVSLDLQPQLVTPVQTNPDDATATDANLYKGTDPITRKTFYEGQAFVVDKTKLNIGVLAGVGVPLGETTTFEFTVRNLGFAHMDYKPSTYTGQPAVLEQSTKRGFSFEIGLSLKI